MIVFSSQDFALRSELIRNQHCIHGEMESKEPGGTLILLKSLYFITASRPASLAVSFIGRAAFALMFCCSWKKCPVCTSWWRHQGALDFGAPCETSCVPTIPTGRSSVLLYDGQDVRPLVQLFLWLRLLITRGEQLIARCHVADTIFGSPLSGHGSLEHLWMCRPYCMKRKTVSFAHKWMYWSDEYLIESKGGREARRFVFTLGKMLSFWNLNIHIIWWWFVRWLNLKWWYPSCWPKSFLSCPS